MARRKTLEAQLTALLQKHDLTGISMTIHRLSDGRVFFSSNAHAKAKNGSHFCTIGGNDFPTFNETIGCAIVKMDAERATDCKAVEGGLSAMEGE